MNRPKSDFTEIAQPRLRRETGAPHKPERAGSAGKGGAAECASFRPLPVARAMESAPTRGIGERPNKHEIVRSRASGGRAISASERSLALLAGFLERIKNLVLAAWPETLCHLLDESNSARTSWMFLASESIYSRLTVSGRSAFMCMIILDADESDVWFTNTDRFILAHAFSDMVLKYFDKLSR